MRIVTIYTKTLEDLAKPKLLVGYFVPVVTFALFVAIGTSNNMMTEGAPLFQQEVELATTFFFMSYTLGVGMPLQALVAVFCALTLAGEAEKGTLRILLSKPVKRWQLYLGTFAAIVTYGLLIGVTGLLIGAVLIYMQSDIAPIALQAGVFDALPGYIAYGLFSVMLVAAVGLALAVYTKDRLRTTIGGLILPVLTFVFISVNLFDVDVYDDFALYLVDPNRHFGNLFVFLHGLVGTDLPNSTQLFLAELSGVYESPDSHFHTPQELVLSGEVPVMLSVVLLTAVLLGALVVGLRQFNQMEV